MTKENWKGKRVIYFDWGLYEGFHPTKVGVVKEETEDGKECLIKVGWSEKLAVKYSENMDKMMAREVGYCKLLKANE